MHTAQLIARIKSAVDNNNYVAKGHELSMRSLIHPIDTGVWYCAQQPGTRFNYLGDGWELKILRVRTGIRQQST